MSRYRYLLTKCVNFREKPRPPNGHVKAKSVRVCSICQKTSSSRVVLSAHNYEHHDIGFKCLQCSTHAQTPRRFLLHIQEKHPSSPLSCCRCNLHFSTSTEFLHHLNLICCGKQRGRHICEICSLTFSAESRLFAHKKSVHGAQLQCLVCQAQFNNLNSLRCHKTKKHDGKDFVCEVRF